MANITVLGLFCVDLITRTERLPNWGESLRGGGFTALPGGKGANQAVAAAYQGATVALISRLGDDGFARMAHELFAQASIDTTYVATDASHPTGTATILVAADTGDNAIVVDTGACGGIEPADIDAAQGVIASSDIFMSQLELPLAVIEHGIAVARTHAVPVILNPAPARPLPDTLYAQVDYLTPNESEAAALVGHPVETDEQIRGAAQTLRDRGIGNVIITLGERGVYIENATHGELIPAHHAGPVVDTIGAGDAFNGALATALAEGAELPEAARRGCLAAGLSVTRAGAAPSLPTRDAVEKASITST
jgi:ribokinase